MASKYELITERYLDTLGEVAKPETWPSFLTTACHNFRLSFDKQVLLYAQKPDATAVLPIEGKHGWNQRFGRWVNRGSKGIALFDSDRNGQATLKYYFDIADTHEGRYPRPVPIWTVLPEHGQAIIETLENHFGELERKDTLASALISAAQNAVEDNAADYLAELIYYKEDSKAIYQVGPESELPEEQTQDAPIVARYLSEEERIVIQQYPNGEYHIRYGYDEERNFANSTAGGFATLEEAEATLLSHRPAAAPVADFSEPEQSVLTPPKAQPKREHITFEPLYPGIPREQRHNFQIDDPELGYGTPTQKYAANVAAIRCLKLIESECRLATPEEQKILSQYVGWGGLSHWFDDRHPKYQELKDLLEYDEYVAARESSLTAFYTSPVIIRAMYQALEQMGFKEGNILEPSCGVGNFLGMIPDSMAGSKTYGVELDSISGRIAQQLYDNAKNATLATNQIGFSSRHPLKTAKKKIQCLHQLPQLTKDLVCVVKDMHTVTITYKLGITNLEFTVGLTENLTPTGDKVNDWLIPRTLRINDKAIDAATDADFVDFIFSKKATEAQYDTVCYAASGAALPECVKPLLTENLLPQFTMETETLQPV